MGFHQSDYYTIVKEPSVGTPVLSFLGVLKGPRLRYALTYKVWLAPCPYTVYTNYTTHHKLAMCFWNTDDPTCKLWLYMAGICLVIDTLLPPPSHPPKNSPRPCLHCKNYSVTVTLFGVNIVAVTMTMPQCSLQIE